MLTKAAILLSYQGMPLLLNYSDFGDDQALNTQSTERNVKLRVKKSLPSIKCKSCKISNVALNYLFGIFNNLSLRFV